MGTRLTQVTSNMWYASNEETSVYSGALEPTV